MIKSIYRTKLARKHFVENLTSFYKNDNRVTLGYCGVHTSIKHSFESDKPLADLWMGPTGTIKITTAKETKNYRCFLKAVKAFEALL